MTAGEKIVERILLDARAEGEAAVSAAEKKAEETVMQAKSEAAETEKSLNRASDLKAERITESAKSGAVLIVRNAVLAKRREEIKKTLESTVDYIIGLPADEYFAALAGLAKRCAQSGKGVMMLNSRDLGRMTGDFKKTVAGFGITVCDNADDHIRGGFILKYNEIEIDEDIMSVISEKKEQLEDLINAELF